MNRRIFQTLRLPGGCIQGTKGLENYIGAGMVHRGGLSNILVGKSKGKRPLGWSKRGWEDNIKMDFKEVGGAMEWIDLAQNSDG